MTPEETRYLKEQEEEQAKRLEYFCGLCDFRESCMFKERYSERNWCGWAKIRGYNASTVVTTTHIQVYIHGAQVTFQRQGKNAIRNLLDAIERAKAGLPRKKYRT